MYEIIKERTFQGILAFQHLQASLRCCSIVRALFCLIPSGIISTISCITDARNSRSKCDSTRCFVTVFATPFECRPSNCLDNKFPNHLSNNGVIPLIKKSHTLHPGAQNPQPGPFPTGPYYIHISKCKLVFVTYSKIIVCNITSSNIT